MIRRAGCGQAGRCYTLLHASQLLPVAARGRAEVYAFTSREMPLGPPKSARSPSRPNAHGYYRNSCPSRSQKLVPNMPWPDPPTHSQQDSDLGDGLVNRRYGCRMPFDLSPRPMLIPALQCSPPLCPVPPSESAPTMSPSQMESVVEFIRRHCSPLSQIGPPCRLRYPAPSVRPHARERTVAVFVADDVLNRDILYALPPRPEPSKRSPELLFRIYGPAIRINSTVRPADAAELVRHGLPAVFAVHIVC